MVWASLSVWQETQPALFALGVGVGHSWVRGAGAARTRL